MSETVTISAARLQELEALEAKIKAKNEKKRIELQQYTDTPDKKQERMRRYIDKDRDAYNAHRREKRRLAKEAVASTPVDA